MNKIWNINTHEKRYCSLYNYLIDNDNLVGKKIINHEHNYIYIYKKILLNIIKNNSKWSNGYKELMYFMIVRWFEINKPLEINYINIFKEEAFKLKKDSDNIESENKLTSIKEKENFRSYSYFIEKLNSIEYNNIKNIKDHFKYLYLALLIYQPPLRTSFYYTSKFIYNIEDNNKINNYIYINNNNISYIVNQDKVSNSKLYSMNLNLSIIDIKNIKLLNLIKDSLNKYPRKFLFELNKKSITEITLSKWLKSITELEGISIDIMRSVYITYFYNNNVTYKSREELSKQMRHSQNTASKNYFKVIEENNDSENIIKELREKISHLENENKILNEQLYHKNN